MVLDKRFCSEKKHVAYRNRLQKRTETDVFEERRLNKLSYPTAEIHQINFFAFLSNQLATTDPCSCMKTKVKIQFNFCPDSNVGICTEIPLVHQEQYGPENTHYSWPKFRYQYQPHLTPDIATCKT
ncbi:hypothetical protein Y032_0314g2211 [Ancylostoma ceylanicum]|nr:hypothetical protein Y032_0314g2211 [Ancylostoma ceylanicum]